MKIHGTSPAQEAAEAYDKKMEGKCKCCKVNPQEIRTRAKREGKIQAFQEAVDLCDPVKDSHLITNLALKGQAVWEGKK